MFHTYRKYGRDVVVAPSTAFQVKTEISTELSSHVYKISPKGMNWHAVSNSFAVELENLKLGYIYYMPSYF